jgi:hypothetical protein
MTIESWALVLLMAAAVAISQMVNNFFAPDVHIQLPASVGKCY